MTKHAVNEETVSTPRHSVWGRIGMLLIILAVAIFMGAFGYGYYELSKVNIALAHSMTSVEQQTADAQQALAALRQTVGTLEDGLSKSQNLAAEQEQLVAEWRSAQKGDLDKWRLAEAQYLIKIANDHLQFTHDTPMAVTLLQRADGTLQNVQNGNVLEIRKAIASDVAALQAVPQVDATSLYLHIDALNGQLENLPLPVDSLKAPATDMAPIEIPANTPWWKAGLIRSWQTLRHFVVVRNTGASGMPLVFPEEKTFLYQNLHAQLQNAMWAVLHRDNDIYQASLMSAAKWIQQYFDQDAPETKTILQNIAELQKMNIKPAELNLDATLQLFNGDSAAAPVPSEAASAAASSADSAVDPASAADQEAN